MSLEKGQDIFKITNRPNGMLEVLLVCETPSTPSRGKESHRAVASFYCFVQSCAHLQRVQVDENKQ
ncbi:hypothetical protein SAMN05421821_12169 [Mucilaginibacter lappiensis]|nr:hypothetical protein SAMN05421821_12169 [Mucilaginibacter lappiensis]